MNWKASPPEAIASVQNLKIKNTVLLQKSRERKKQNLFVVEGSKEVDRALQAGYAFKNIFICQAIFKEANSTQLRQLLDKDAPKTEINFVTPRVYAHMAYRKESEGIIGWAVPHRHELTQIQLSGRPLLLIIDAVEKPGNLGAILRTADAAGIDALIISDPRTDVYNPNVVRSSLGALFSVQIGMGMAEEVIRWLKEREVHLYCTALTASIPYTDIDFKQSAAIVMGSEATGLPEAWLTQSDQNIIIPMQGVVDSMNVSVSAGIVLFEALRQRNLK